MKVTIYCKTETKGQQTFYLCIDGKSYYLFRQEYRTSVKEHFGNGLRLSETCNYSNTHSEAVRRTLDKLPMYIRYAEKEYGIAVYDKTKNLLGINKPKKRIARGAERRMLIEQYA